MFSERKSLKAGKLQPIAVGKLARQRSLPLQKRWVRIVEPAVNRVRRKVAEAFFIQYPQGRHERPWVVDDLGRKSISLVFVATRPPVGQRREPKCHDTAQQSKQQEGRSDIAGREAKGAIEPLLAGKNREAIQSRQRTKGGHQ